MRSTQQFPRSVIEVDVEKLDVTRFKPGAHRVRVRVGEDGLGSPLRIPVQVLRGAEDGPVVGITAAVHGNEVNGIPTIHRLFRRLDHKQLKGTVVAAAPLNLPGYLRNTREYSDGKDLNRLFPGKADGTESQVYAHAILERIVRPFDILLDLHTASFGRINSLYIRADMRHAKAAELARVIKPQIIVHNEGGDGTLRGAAEELGITAVTVEIGNPQRTQEELIRFSSIGLRDALEHLEMVPNDEETPPTDTVECSSSFWLYTDGGGMLEVFPGLCERITKGQQVAQLINEWGEVHRTYEAPEDGIVVGKATNPVAQSGSRILHLGIVGRAHLAT